MLRLLGSVAAWFVCFLRDVGSLPVAALTTYAATLSDCQQLVQPDTWGSAWAAGNNVCQFVVAHRVLYSVRH